MSHVRFSTPAGPVYMPKMTPSQTMGMNSCNAGVLNPLHDALHIVRSSFAVVHRTGMPPVQTFSDECANPYVHMFSFRDGMPLCRLHHMLKMASAKAAGALGKSPNRKICPCRVHTIQAAGVVPCQICLRTQTSYLAALAIVMRRLPQPVLMDAIK